MLDISQASNFGTVASQGWRTSPGSLWVGAPLHCALHDLTKVLWDGFRQDLLRPRSGIPPLLYGRPRLHKQFIKPSGSNKTGPS